MSLILAEPSLQYIDSYIEAVDEGFENMQLKFGDAKAKVIRDDPQGYLNILKQSKPFKYQDYNIQEHSIMWFVDMEAKRFLGSVSIRYKADDFILYDFAGHIGMSVRPSVLQKGYGVKMAGILEDWIIQNRQKFSSPHIFATCYKENRASARLIEYFGGMLKKEIHNTDNDRVSYIYEMDTK